MSQGEENGDCVLTFSLPLVPSMFAGFFFFFPCGRVLIILIIIILIIIINYINNIINILRNAFLIKT